MAWRRDVIGQLISRLRDLGASTVALDIVFANPTAYDGAGCRRMQPLRKSFDMAGLFSATR